MDHRHRIFIFLFLVITFITTSITTSSTFQWSSLDEESQARIAGQVYQEVRLFDRLLGTLLARKAERAWRAEVAPKQDLPNFEDVNEETERYLETLALWAKSRYYDLLHCPTSNDDEEDVLDENVHPAEVLRKYLVSCQYLKTLLTRYYYSADDEENSTVAAKDSADSFAKESMAKLAALYRTMPAVEYRGRRYQGEDALEQLMMTSAEDQNLLKRLWTARSKATVGLGDTFREIMATLASSGRGEALWNRWNADLGIVPANRSLPLAVELWSGQLKEFYDLLLDFIAHRLELSRDKNGSIEVQKLGSFSATSFDRLLLTSKKRIIPFPEVLQEEEEENSTEENSFQELLQKAQEVFTELGFEKLPEGYWENSIFKEEEDDFEEVSTSPSFSSCHPLTFYFFRRADVRTRMCYQKNDPRSSWRRVLHELGHAHYYLAYDNASLFSLYKSRPNSAIHEAVGEAVILLQDGCQAASREFQESPKSLINRLLSEAVTSFVRLPYALSLERWRHELMTGKGSLSAKEMNSRYWEIRDEVSRVKSPENDRDEDENFPAVDALSKYHVAFFMPYLRYFYGTLMMHQIQATLCKEELQDSVLANCCPKAEAMERFRDFLARGALPEEYLQSNWDVLTGGSSGGGETWGYSSGPLLEYYRPLIEWLKEYKELLLENQL